VTEEIQQAKEIYRLMTEFIVNYSFQILGAMLILLAGFFVANKVSKLVGGVCERNHLDVTLSRFLSGVTKIVIIAMVAVVALGKLGISIGPFVAAVGAVSLGAGLAVQGLLSNYGAGLAIIMTRPFVVGDTISIQGVTGVVQEVRLANVLLVDEDDVQITIPNKHIVGEIIRNSHGYSLIELSVGISYGNDPQRAVEVIQSALQTITAIHERRPPLVGIDRFGDNGIDLGLRFWGPTRKLFQLRYEVNQRVHLALKEAGISIPFPQREVRLFREEG